MLKGEKVTLRALEKDDLEVLHGFVNDLEMHSLADDDVFVPQSHEQVEKMFAEFGKSAEEIGPFGIEADGKLIGTCGLHHVDLNSGVCAFGINISDKDYLSKGYGTDALKVLIDYCFRLRNFRKLWLTVYGDNERAIGAYRKLGFVEEGRHKEHIYNQGTFKDWVLMALFRRDWDPDLET